MLEDAGSVFDVIVVKPAVPRAVVLFAVGAGGAPERHMRLLQAVSAHGALVIAPSFSRLVSPMATATELTGRARRMEVAFDALGDLNLPLAGIGHSVGTAVLLILAGGEASTFAGDIVQARLSRPIRKLALMAPPTQFFQAAGALDHVEAQLAIWAGGHDDITPPSQARLLERAMRGRTTVRLHVLADAGHFSFMDEPPPHVTDPLENREAFLDSLAQQIGAFVLE